MTAALESTRAKFDTDDDLLAAPLRVLIADDHPLILIGMRRVLEREDDIEIVGEAQTGTALIALIERRRPDIVLLDLHMPGLDGTSCVAVISERWPEVKTVVLSACDERAAIDGALAAGASSYIVKTVAGVDVAAVLRQTHSGAVYHAQAAGSPTDHSPQTGEALLTERESAILEAIASGLTTRAISQELWVSEHTVKFHLTNIYRKLGVSNRSAAVRCAFERQLAPIR